MTLQPITKGVPLSGKLWTILTLSFQSSRGAGLAGGDLDRGAERDGRRQGGQRAQETRGKIQLFLLNFVQKFNIIGLLNCRNLL